jgi:hypothetical protein
MNSKNLEARGFIGWFIFEPSQERALLNHLPTEQGVYVIISHVPKNYLVGHSDILYFGKAANESGGIRQRVRQYFHPGWDNRTSLRNNEFMKEHEGLSIGYLLADKSMVKHIEEKLIAEFKASHGTRPFLNRQD